MKAAFILARFSEKLEILVIVHGICQANERTNELPAGGAAFESFMKRPAGRAAFHLFGREPF
jgi:hypothetical protein